MIVEALIDKASHDRNSTSPPHFLLCLHPAASIHDAHWFLMVNRVAKSRGYGAAKREEVHDLTWQ